MSTIIHDAHSVSIAKPTVAKSGEMFMDIVIKLGNGYDIVATVFFKDQIRLEVEQ